MRNIIYKIFYNPGIGKTHHILSWLYFVQSLTSGAHRDTSPEHIKKIHFTVALVSLLTACGGGSSSNNTLPAGDTTKPVVTSTKPVANKTDVKLFEPITVTFSENVIDITESNIRIFAYDSLDVDKAKLITTQKIPLLSFNYDSASKTLSIEPDTTVAPKYQTETRYQVVITGVQDKANNYIAADFTLEFTTITIPYGQLQPAEGKTGVSRGSDITILFSEAMIINNSSFTLLDMGPLSAAATTGVAVTDVTYRFDKDNNIATFTTQPTLLLAENRYQFTLNVTATDQAGNSIANDIISNFSTGVATSSSTLATQPKQINAVPHNNLVDITWLTPDPIPETPNLTYTYNL